MLFIFRINNLHYALRPPTKFHDTKMRMMVVSGLHQRDKNLYQRDILTIGFGGFAFSFNLCSG